MSDQKRWFKVWHTILTDPSFMDLPLDKIGQWTLLGALMAAHGSGGKLTISRQALYAILRVKNDNGDDNGDDNILMLPNVRIEEGNNDNGKITVIIEKWAKYQLDSTGYERLKRHRMNANDNGAREDKEKTKTKRRNNTPIPPQKNDSAFDTFWKAYPKKIGKADAVKAWGKLDPQNGTIEKIMTSLEQWKKTTQWTKDNGEFIPHPSTWLNGRRWEDEVTANKSHGGEFEHYKVL